MKRKIFSILFALVLVCSFSLVTAVPAGADDAYEPTIGWWQSSVPDSGVAEFSTAQFHSADYSAHLVAYVAESPDDYHEAYVANPTGVELLDDLEDVSFWYYCPSGENAVAPLIDVWLDLDGNYSSVFPPAGDEEWLLGMLTDVTMFDAWVEITADDITWVRATGGEVYGVGAAGLANAKAETDSVSGYATLGDCPVLAIGVETGGPGTYISSRSYDMDFYVDDITINGITYAMNPRVVNTTQTAGYVTIQEAIDAADPDDTISVAAGTYSEWQDVSVFGAGKSTGIMIDKSLTVEGANAGVPATEERGPESTINAQEADMGVLINGEDTVATFDGFTVENYDTIGILGGAFGDWGDDPDEVHILNNIVGPPMSAPPNNNCIQVGDGTTGTVIGNEVSGASLESPDWTGSGILVAGSSDVVIYNNYAHDCESGIVIVGYAEYRDAPAEDNLIEDNLVENCGTGISVQMYSIDTIIRYNDVLSNDGGIAVMAIDYSWEHSTPSDTEIHYNNIVGNENYGVKSGLWGSNTGNVPAEEVDATKNWWGHSSGPTASPGSGDKVSGDVDYEPWLLTEGGDPYDWTLSLPVGWSIVSPDSELESWVAVDAEELMYAYDNGGFTTSFVLDAVTPMFIKTVDGGGIGFNYAVDSMGMFTTNLESGWNLIGVPETDATARAILSPLRYGVNSEVALATLASQGNYNPSGESFYRSALANADWLTFLVLDLYPFDGYWAYMNVAKEFGVVVVPGPK